MAFISPLPLHSSPFLHHSILPRTITPYPRRTRRPSYLPRPPLCNQSLPTTHSHREQQLLTTLKQVIDPDLNADIVTLGFVKDINFTPVPSLPELFDVSFKVELTTPACPVKHLFQQDCKRLAENLPWVGKADVIMTAAPPQNTSTSTGAMDEVAAVIAVASCKGGVGKSTTAVNLAFALAKQGARVGIMDADVYGPSLPTMVHPEERAVQFSGGRIRPLEAYGVKLMSFGYVNSNSAIMRGPMIGNVVNQLLSTTAWGKLDYLVVDLPPGTGDVQLTVCQILNVTAAVIVTTPQKLAFVDVVKGIDMFEKVSVPCVSVVENMAYFEVPESGVKHYVFGKGHRERLVEQYGLKNSFSMPIVSAVSERSDSGVPFVVAEPDSEASTVYGRLAEAVVREVAKIQYIGLGIPDVQFDENEGNIVVRRGGEANVQKIWPPTLRRQCRCAICVDEMTGEMKLDPESVSEDVKPVNMRKVGNYALEVGWSDGHRSLYPYARFVDDYGGVRERERVESSVAQ